MKINTQDYNQVTVVELAGELDEDVAQLLKNNITDMVTKRKTALVLDLSQVSFIDSQGLEQLLWARHYCSENNCELRLAGLDENCAKILEVTRLDGEFQTYAELAQAVKSFA